MSKLDTILVEERYRDGFFAEEAEEEAEEEMEHSPELLGIRTRIKYLMLEMVGDVEQRETNDMSLKSWTSEDYKSFGKNELIVELRQKIHEL